MRARDQLQMVRRLPGMVFWPAELRFEILVTYVLGMDAQSGGLLLYGFREFLLLRGATPPNLAWPALVLVLSDIEPKRGLSPQRG